MRASTALLIIIIAVPVAAHDPYTGMRAPDGTLCCSDRDCRPAQECRAPSGGLGFVWHDLCYALPPDRYVPLPPTLQDDHRLHVCLQFHQGMPFVRCWTAPLGT